MDNRTIIGRHEGPQKRFALRAEDCIVFDRTVFGRDPEGATIVLNHPLVSRVHAELVRQGNAFILQDLGSSNGTFLDGQRVVSPQAIHIGNRIDIGPYTLVFQGGHFEPQSRVGNSQLSAENLTVRVPNRNGPGLVSILNDVSLSISANEFVCILGPSGCGKSTLMNALCARMPATEGTVTLNDLNLYANFEALKHDLALVPQKEVLHEHLTVENALAFTARLRLPNDTSPSVARDEIHTVLDSVGLLEHRSKKIMQLSGGQRKRAALANETLCRPNLLFLDEVTSGLDEGTDWEMMGLFRKQAEAGKTVVCVTHTIANVEEFCHKLIVMAVPGILAFYGSPAEAREYFGVEQLGSIYQRLSNGDGKFWQAQYRRSSCHEQHVAGALADRKTPDSDEVRCPSEGSKTQETLKEDKRQFGILFDRLIKLTMADSSALGVSAAQSVLIGALLVVVFGKMSSGGPQEGSLLFFLGISSIWFGCNNASKELVKERDIYQRERDVNLSINSYVLSKFCVLGLVGTLQVLLFFSVVSILGRVPGNGILQLVQMEAAVLAGTALGLLISGSCSTPDQATTTVPIVLIPQILLAGVIVPELPTLADFFAKFGVTAYWINKGMIGALVKDHGQWINGLLAILVHTVVFTIATIAMLRRRDVRGPKPLTSATIKKWMDKAQRYVKHGSTSQP